MSSRFIGPFFDAGNGISPSDGAQLFFFESGTSTPKDTFTDEALTIPNTNPVKANADGLFSDIWIDDGDRFKVQLKDKNDVQEWEADPVVQSVQVSDITNINLNFVSDMVASATLKVGNVVTVEDYSALIDSGVMWFNIVSAGTGTANGGSFIDLPNTTPATQAQQIFSNYTSIKQFGNDDLAATAFLFSVDKAMSIDSDETVILKSDPTSGDDIQAQVAWMRQCSVSGDGTFYLELADGTHTVDTFVDIDGLGTPIDWRAENPVTFIQITAINYSIVDAPNFIFQADVTVDTALPATAVVGGPIGIQNAQGTLDVASINGAQIIKTIAGDRLSYTFNLFSPEGNLSNGVLDNTLTNGLVANQTVVFNSSLIALNTGWDGGAREGFINCLNGGQMTIRDIGIAYSGDSDTEHDLIFARGSSSRFYAFDHSGFAGAGDKVLRSFGGAEFFINRSYIGGAAKAQELFQGTAGGFNQFVRSSSGGGLLGGFTCGHASFANFAQAPLANCGIALRTTTQNAAIAAFPIQLHKCTTAILATQGTISGTTATDIKRCNTGVDWAGGGVVTGAFNMGAGLDVNAFDSIAPGNQYFEGGIWYEQTATNGFYDNLIVASLTASDKISVVGGTPKIELTDGALTATLDGNSGAAILDTATAGRDITFSAAGIANWIMDMGTDELLPATDNTNALGNASFRCSELFAAIGTINTSDGELKDVRGALTAQELSAWGNVSPVVYRFKDAIEKKGAGARSHFGYVAQYIQQAFLDAGLNAADYGLFCADPLFEAENYVDEEDKPQRRLIPVLDEGGVQVIRYGLRYDQCAVMEAAYNRSLIVSLEARIQALEAI